VVWSASAGGMARGWGGIFPKRAGPEYLAKLWWYGCRLRWLVSPMADLTMKAEKFASDYELGSVGTFSSLA
jgi:hypothetical protein